jgi:hypothetical protein
MGRAAPGYDNDRERNNAPASSSGHVEFLESQKKP